MCTMRMPSWIMVCLVACCTVAVLQHATANSIVSIVGGITNPAKPGFTRIEGAMVPRWCEASITKLPKSTAEVSSIIKNLRATCGNNGDGKKKLSIRAFRTMYHSASDMPCPDLDADCSAVLDMGAMNQVISLDRLAQTVMAGPGLTFNDLLVWLERRDLEVPWHVLPMYSNLTLAGMLLTGAHGSSRTLPASFGNIVAGAEWVDARGEVHRTDDARQLTGTLGALGVITQVSVKVKPLGKLKITTWRVPHDGLLFPMIPKLLAKNDLAIIRWLPDVHQAFVTFRDEVDKSSKGDAEWAVFKSNPLVGIASGPTMGIQQMDDGLFGNLLGVQDDLPICLAAAVSMPLTAEHMIPTPDGVAATGRLSKMVAGECEPGPDMGCLWRSIPVNLLELDFAVSDLLSWMHDVRNIFLKEVHGCIPSVIEFAVRFGKSSEHPLDMHYGRDSVSIDVVSNKGLFMEDLPSAYQHVFDEIEQLTLCKYQARPHWGKNSNRAFTNPNPGCRVRDKYPRFGEFISKIRAADPERIFESPVLAEVLGDRPVPNSKGCAVQARCYCTSDEHCGFHHKCVPGNTFPEYKVCKSAKLVVEDSIMSKIFHGKLWAGK